MVEDGITVSAIFRVEDVPGSSKKSINNEITEEGVNLNWENLRALASPGFKLLILGFDSSPWGNVAFSTFLATEYQGSKEIFELISKRIFNILQRRRNYEDYFANDNLIIIPTFIKSKLDLRYYGF